MTLMLILMIQVGAALKMEVNIKDYHGSLRIGF